MKASDMLYEEIDEHLEKLEDQNQKLRKHLKRVLDAFLMDMPTASKRRSEATEYLKELEQLHP